MTPFLAACFSIACLPYELGPGSFPVQTSTDTVTYRNASGRTTAVCLMTNQGYRCHAINAAPGGTSPIWR